jgi:hypothetical protein
MIVVQLTAVGCHKLQRRHADGVPYAFIAAWVCFERKKSLGGFRSGSKISLGTFNPGTYYKWPILGLK